MDINEYLEQHCSEESRWLKDIVRSTHLCQVNPHMLSGRLQGRFLSMISHLTGPKRILELGTFTAYSTLCLAEGLQGDDAMLVTIESNEELEDTIRQNLQQTPYSDKIHLLIGDATRLLADEYQQILRSEPFDLVFIDADKREYETYYKLVMPLVRTNGLVIADNTLWDGHVTDSAYDHDKQTLAIRKFNDMVTADERAESLILPLRDGLTMIRKIKN